MGIPPFGSPPVPPASATKQGKLKLAGDLAGAGGTADAPALTAFGPGAGTYGSASLIPVVQIDAKGRVQSVTPTAVTASTQRSFAFFMG